MIIGGLFIQGIVQAYPHYSPYAYALCNPVNCIDPDGRRPIYSTMGYLLGTDDNGLQGDAIIMDSQFFHQGMHHWNSLHNVMRNIETVIGHGIAGRGVEYKIHIYGSKSILLFSFIALVVLLLYTALFPPSGEKALGDGYYYLECEGHTRHIYYWKESDSTTIFIPPEVLSYVNTSIFILAKQKPNQFDEVVYEKFYNYPSGRDTTYYWFVNKQEKDLTGPLLYSEMESFLCDKDMIQILQML